jgi:cephalosporin hydroxylase
MKLILDTKAKTLGIEKNSEQRVIQLYSKEAFELLSYQWLKVGWDQKYTYTFAWMGRPIIQLPEDMFRSQEVIWRVKPDVIIETGIAHGGSLIFYASLCKMMEKGRVIGVDIEIRPHNREAIEAHELFPFITLVEGDSIGPKIVKKVKSLIKPHEVVLAILDSCHTKNHVLKELEAYHDLITPGSYIVVTDGFMKYLYDVPRGKVEWKKDNPVEAANEFLKRHPEFEIGQPGWLFNESELIENVTHWSEAYLKRK